MYRTNNNQGKRYELGKRNKNNDDRFTQQLVVLVFLQVLDRPPGAQAQFQRADLCILQPDILRKHDQVTFGATIMRIRLGHHVALATEHPGIADIVRKGDFINQQLNRMVVVPDHTVCQ